MDEDVVIVANYTVLLIILCLQGTGSLGLTYPILCIYFLFKDLSRDESSANRTRFTRESHKNCTI